MFHLRCLNDQMILKWLSIEFYHTFQIGLQAAIRLVHVQVIDVRIPIRHWSLIKYWIVVGTNEVEILVVEIKVRLNTRQLKIMVPLSPYMGRLL